MKKKLLLCLAYIFLFTSISSLIACEEVEEPAFVAQNGIITGLTEYGRTLTELTVPDSIDGVDVIGFRDDLFLFYR